MPLAPGTRLGPYEIVGPLGAGGMGEVYRGRDTRLGRALAIKVLHPAASATDRRRLLREARIISTLSDPHICSLFDIGNEGDRDFLVMEYLDGESLAHRLSRGPLPLAEALTIAAQTAKALGCAHSAGVIHRDLKPGNIMLTKSGAKLLDFGLSRIDAASPAIDLKTHSRLTLPGTIVGTLNYMAPEVLRGDAADARSDVFALGCILFQMLTGLRPFDAPSYLTLTTNILEEEVPPVSSLVAVPAAVDRAVARCLDKNPDQRWQNAFDLASELEWLAGGHPGGGAQIAEVAFTVTRADVVRFNLHHASHRLLNWVVIVIAAAVIGGSITAGVPLWAGIAIDTMLLLFFAGFLFLMTAVAAFFSSVQAKNRVVFGPHRLTLTAADITEVTPVSRSTWSWPAVQIVRQNRSYIFIYVQQNGAHIIPKRAFGSSDRARQFYDAARSALMGARRSASAASAAGPPP